MIRRQHTRQAPTQPRPSSRVPQRLEVKAPQNLSTGRDASIYPRRSAQSRRHHPPLVQTSPACPPVDKPLRVGSKTRRAGRPSVTRVATAFDGRFALLLKLAALLARLVPTKVPLLRSGRGQCITREVLQTNSSPVASSAGQ